MARPAHHLVTDVQRIHDIQREKGDVWSFENVAAGIEHEIRCLARRRYGCSSLSQSRQRIAFELQTRQHHDIPAGVAEFRHALAPPLNQLEIVLPDRDTCHGQQKARIDAVVARLDTRTAERARRCPSAGRLGAVARAQDIDDPRYDGGRRRACYVGWLSAWTDFDTLAASRAGIKHIADAIVQRRLETESTAPVSQRRFPEHTRSGSICQSVGRRFEVEADAAAAGHFAAPSPMTENGPQ